MAFTELKKAVTRKVPNIDQGLVVTLYPGGVLGLRPLRARRNYTIHLSTCYQLAVYQAQEEKKRKQAADRKARKAAR